jgi:hypothetical protein
MKAYNEAHKEELKARYQANKTYRLAVMKVYYDANKEKLKAYYQAHRAEISEKERKRGTQKPRFRKGNSEIFAIYTPAFAGSMDGA